jgi:electron transfer flavoprotein alpha subunit
MESARLETEFMSINSDPNAPIFDVAHLGIFGDLFQVVPEPIRRLEAGG